MPRQLACTMILALLLVGSLEAQREDIEVAMGAAVGPGWNLSRGAETDALGFSYLAHGRVMLGRRFGLGPQLSRWWSSFGSDTSATSTLVIVWLRPTSSSVFVTVGIGRARAVLVDSVTRVANSRNGLALAGGLSAELPVLGPLRVAGHAHLIIQKFAAFADFPTTNSTLSLGLGLTYAMNVRK